MSSAHIADMIRPDTPPPVTDDLANYLHSLSAFDLLSAEQEVELAAAIEAGLYAGHLLSGTAVEPGDRADLESVERLGREAMDTFYKANLRLVVFVAKRHRDRGLPFSDLIQEGNLGLWHAVRKFDHTKDIKFSTYAVWWIRAAITQGVADQSRTVRLPVKQAAMVAKVAMAAGQFSAANDRKPTVEELARETGLPESNVSQALVWGLQPDSLDSSPGDEGDEYGTLWDPHEPTPFDHAARREMAEKVSSALSLLPSRSAEILSLRFGLTDGQPRTLREVGATLGLSAEHIRKIEAKAIDALRGPDGSSLLDFYETPAGHVFPVRRAGRTPLAA